MSVIVLLDWWQLKLGDSLTHLFVDASGMHAVWQSPVADCVLPDPFTMFLDLIIASAVDVGGRMVVDLPPVALISTDLEQV